MALLLTVLGAATLARLGVAIAISVIAMLSLNYFFLPPLGAFTIADPQNWIALVAFLVVAILASNLSAAAQDRAREANASRHGPRMQLTDRVAHCAANDPPVPQHCSF